MKGYASIAKNELILVFFLGNLWKIEKLLNFFFEKHYKVVHMQIWIQKCGNIAYRNSK